MHVQRETPATVRCGSSQHPSSGQRQQDGVMAARVPWRVLVVTAALGLCLLPLVIVRWQATTLLPNRHSLIRQLQARMDLWSERGCQVQGHQLALGEARTWIQTEGTDVHSTDVCVTCLCDVQQASAVPRPACDMYRCPAHMCLPSGGRYQPEHPCCRACADAAGPAAERPHKQSGSQTEPAQQPLAIDPAVPLTRDIYTSSFRHLPGGACAADRGASAAALVAVLSTPSAAARRDIFRRTYGAEAAARGMQMIFVLGRDAVVQKPLNNFESGAETEYDDEDVISDGDSLAGRQRLVDLEASEHGDILQSEVPEHYNHLGLKTLSLLDYVRANCSAVPMVAKTDDDVLLTLRRLSEAFASLDHSAGIHGRLCVDCPAQRINYRWYVSVREWPWPRFPAFVHGPGYIVVGDAVARLYEAAHHTRYLHLEDVFITGVLAEAAGVRRSPWPRLCRGLVPGGEMCALARCAFTHNDDYADNGETVRLFASVAERLNIDEICVANETVSEF